MTSRRVMTFFAFLVSLLGSAVYAWDGTVRGKIEQIDVTNAGNFPFRVVLQGHPILCSSGQNWAYLDDKDANYRVNVSVLMTAKVTGSDVHLYTVKDPISGFCQIGYVQMF